MGFENGIYMVGKNDCPWVTARRVLTQQNKKVTNSAIAAEMERLAKLNGCESVDDFSDKFYSKVGLEIKYQEQPPKELPKPIKREKTHEFEEADSTRVVMNPVIKEKSIPEDTTKVEPKPVAPEDSTKVVPKPVAPVDSTKVVTPVPPAPDKPVEKQKEVADPIQKINAIPDDLEKVKEYNKQNGNGNYVVVDKKTCTATVYDKNGNALESYEVLLGAEKGDKMSTAYAADKTLSQCTTVPGEYTFTSQDSDFGMCLCMGELNETNDPDIQFRKWAPGYWGEKTFTGSYQALHGTAYEERDKLYGDGNLDNNRVSLGCINIPLDDIQEMQQKYGIKVNSKIYILPEDKGNSLELRKMKDGTTKFITKYADPEQQAKVDKVQNGIAEKNYQKQLAQAKKEQAAKAKAEQEHQIAEAKQRKENFRIYDPTTWYWPWA